MFKTAKACLGEFLQEDMGFAVLGFNTMKRLTIITLIRICKLKIMQRIDKCNSKAI